MKKSKKKKHHKKRYTPLGSQDLYNITETYLTCRVCIAEQVIVIKKLVQPQSGKTYISSLERLTSLGNIEA